MGYFLEKKKLWILLSIKNKKVNGYSICIENNNHKDGLKRAYLIDLISLDEREDVGINLIGASIKEAKKRGCHIIEFRGFDKLQRSYINFFKPFVKKLSSNPFYYKSSNNKLNGILNKDEHWSPTYIEGDTITNF